MADHPIKEALRQRDITQAQAVQEIGMSHSYLSMMLSQVRPMSPRYQARLMALLNKHPVKWVPA